MRIPARRLRVYPNPWGVKPWGLDKVDPSSITLDAEGRPCGAVFADKYEGGGAGYVGAEVDATKTKLRAPGQALKPLRKIGVALEETYPRQTTVWSFMGISAEDPQLAEKLAKCEPLSLPPSPYYREQIQDGHLIAADAVTAKAAGKPVQFVPIAQLMPALEAAAIKAFDSSYEEPGAHKFFTEERARLEREAKVPAKAETNKPTGETETPSTDGDQTTTEGGGAKPSQKKGSK